MPRAPDMAEAPAPRLTVAVATTAARAPRLTTALLPPVPGVIWAVFVQGQPADEAALRHGLGRADIRVVLSDGTGAARNRNAALDAVQTEFLLLADDDLTFSATGIAALIDRFAHSPDVDFLLARLADETGAPRKRYSPDGTRARWFNTGRIQTPEIALRMAPIRRAGLRFDEAFGAGVPVWLGDEYIFLCDALRAGVRGRHVDVIVAAHPTESSGANFAQAAMAVRRKVLIRALGRGPSLPARLAFALRHWRKIGAGGFWALLRP